MTITIPTAILIGIRIISLPLSASIGLRSIPVRPDWSREAWTHVPSWGIEIGMGSLFLGGFIAGPFNVPGMILLILSAWCVLPARWIAAMQQHSH